MFIGYFTERPYQDPKSGYFGATGKSIMDLNVSNDIYDAELGASLYNRYLDEKLYAEEMGFDGLMLNEHHSTPFCMGGAMNVEASILARITNRAKIVLLGNILPLWDDPLWLVEQLSMIDMISHGRLVSGWVRGTGRESVAHNIEPHYNWERFKEAHELIVKAWTTPGPFRWEGKHFHFRHVNPWVRPYQKPHPPIWLPGVVSRDSLMWAAEQRIPYIMLATEMEPTKQAFQIYHDTAAELGYESGPQNIGYLWKVHVDETEELAEATGPQVRAGAQQPLPGRQRRHDQPGPAAPARPDLPPASAAHHVGRHRRPRRQRGARRRAVPPLRAAGQRLHHHLRHTGQRDPEDPPRTGDHPPRQHLLLGRRRRHDPRRRHAQSAPDGTGSPARRPRDGQGTGSARPLRG